MLQQNRKQVRPCLSPNPSRPEGSDTASAAQMKATASKDGGERSLLRQLGMKPNRTYLSSLSPEREKILALTLSSPFLRQEVSGATSAAGGASEAGEQEMPPRAKDT